MRPKLTKGRIIAVVAIALVAGVIAWFEPEFIFTKESLNSRQAGCERNGGKWLADYGECQQAEMGWCELAGGRFDECAKPCRNSPEPVLPCVQQCQEVCFFPPDERPDAPDFGQPTPLNLIYEIEGKSIRFDDGISQDKIDPDKAYRSEAQTIGQIPPGDLNGDGLEDVGILIEHDQGGKARMLYLAAAIRLPEGGYRGTNALKVGEHVTINSGEFRDGQLRFNYLGRHPWQGRNDRATVNRTKLAGLEGNRLVNLTAEMLSEEEAEALAIKELGGCGPGKCTDLNVSVTDAGDNLWYMDVTYYGLADDSVRVSKKTLPVRYFSGGWHPGKVLLTETVCQPGRGHQEFSSEPCL